MNINSKQNQLIIATKSLPQQQQIGRQLKTSQPQHRQQQNDSNATQQCIECGKHFVSNSKLKSHEKTHSKSRPFKCIDCGKTFTGFHSIHIYIIDYSFIYWLIDWLISAIFIDMSHSNAYERTSLSGNQWSKPSLLSLLSFIND